MSAVLARERGEEFVQVRVGFFSDHLAMYEGKFPFKPAHQGYCLLGTDSIP